MNRKISGGSMNNRNKKYLTIASACCLSLMMIMVVFLSQGFPSIFARATQDSNSLVISSSNPVTNGYIKTTKGNPIYVRNDGVTWNDSNLVFANGGYIQTLSVIHGIQSVNVELSSGSIDLYHDYIEPTNLETPMYGIDYTFNSSYTFSFDSYLPNRIRLRASEETVVSKITINFDCYSANNDVYLETLDDGLENSYIDAGTIARYATTSYSLDTASADSNRSLKLSFKGTTNNFVLLSPQKNQMEELVDYLPDFTNAVLSLKAKFSNNIQNHNISIQAVGSSWASSGYIVMNCSNIDSDGWYTYFADFSGITFDDNNEIIRIYVRPDGVDESNKASAFVLLDEIDYADHLRNQEIAHESVYDGLENMARDVSYENTYVSFDNAVTYGRKSKSSLVARPKESIGSDSHYYVVLSPEHHTGFSTSIVTDLSQGMFMFEYKPINIQNPSIIYFMCLETWSNYATKTVSTTALKNGWYLFKYDLSGFNFTSPTMIRIRIGFDVETNSIEKSKVYFDNIRVEDTSVEDYTQGLENLDQDGGMSGYANSSVDYSMTANDSSLNSIKFTLNGNTTGWQGNYGPFYYIHDRVDQLTCDSGTLEAKFLFNSSFTTKEVWLNLVDSNWTGARFRGIIPEPIGNGWYQISIDLSTLQAWPGEKMTTGVFDYTSHPIRIGFGFPDASGFGSNNQNVWIDDVFYYPNSSSSNFTLWQAYDTENIRQGDSVIANRGITIFNPLSFSDARNGTDSSQLMIKANFNISSYSFRPGTLRGDNGDTLSSTSFEVLIAKYLYVGDSNNGEAGKTGHMGTGYYPDALVPIDRIIKANENTITSGNQQSIWINCNIPVDQHSGTYTGYGILNVDGIDYSIPMKVIVYNVTLDGISHNKTSFLIWYEKVELAEPVYDRTMRQAYYDFLLEKGISPHSNYDWSKWEVDDMNIYDSFAYNFAEYIMPNPKISTYHIPAEKTQESITNYLLALANRNKVEWDNGNHVNFFDKAILVLTDEPSNPSWNNTEPDAWKTCKNVQTYVKNAISSISSSLVGYPEILAGLNNIRNVTTIGCDYEKITGGKSGLITYKNLLTTDYIGVPCPQFSKVDNADERETYLGRFNKAWFYGCSNPQLPYPSYHMDTPLIGQRLITWMQYDYGFEGTLYFCTDMYTTTDQNNILRDVWTDPMVGMYAGDGQLTYPGARYNIYGPITTMRLENIRNSMEDYEYFYLMDQRLSIYNANTGSSISSCKDLLSSEFSQMFSGTQLLARGHTFNNGYKSEDFETIRTYLLERLEYCF